MCAWTALVMLLPRDPLQHARRLRVAEWQRGERHLRPTRRVGRELRVEQARLRIVGVGQRHGAPLRGDPDDARRDARGYEVETLLGRTAAVTDAAAALGYEDVRNDVAA